MCNKMVILISFPGPRREALLAILRCSLAYEEIFSFADLAETGAQLKIPDAELIILDQGVLDGNQLKLSIPLIRQWNRQALIVLIVGHPREIFQEALYRPDAILCDGFSSASLAQEMERLKLPRGPLCG